jgi:hypothetical protein
MRTGDPGGSFGGAHDPDLGGPGRRVTLHDGPYRARSLGGGAQVVVNLADHAAQIASSAVGPRHRRRRAEPKRAGLLGAADEARVPHGLPVRTPERRLSVQIKDLSRAAVTTDVDGLWQVHPRRLLEYSPQDLHTIGWFPWPSRFHLSVTVFASRALHVQTVCLAAWTALIHATKLGVDDAHSKNFKAIFGTAYLGSLASMGVIIALVLGLFISLVVQRWWDVRTQYATFHHALLELAVAFATREGKSTTEVSSSSSDASEEGDVPSTKRSAASSKTTAEHSQSKASRKRSKKALTGRLTRDATNELFRLLNLAHVLFLSQAGEREHAVTGARRLRRAPAGFFFSGLLPRNLRLNTRPRVTAPRAASVDEESAGVEFDAVETDAETDAETNAGSDSVETSRESVATPRPERRRRRKPRFQSDETIRFKENGFDDTHDGSADPPCRGERQNDPLPSVASTAVFLDDENILSKHVTHLDREDCVALGLVTHEEWEALRAARAAGLPRFVAVLCWAHRLLETCASKGVCSWETKRTACVKLADARQAAGRVSTYLASQLPYTYVNLVSLVVHVYLFVLSTWFGFVLNSGLNAVEMDGVFASSGAEQTSRTSEPGEVSKASFFVAERDEGFSSDFLTIVFCYAFLAFSNVLFQGLLHIHALLDNPFGHHPAKFPLRQFVAQLVGQTSALAAGAHEPPDLSPSVSMFFASPDSDSGGDESEEPSEDEAR